MLLPTKLTPILRLRFFIKSIVESIIYYNVHVSQSKLFRFKKGEEVEGSELYAILILAGQVSSVSFFLFIVV
jgi:hypothetical protein